MAQIEFNDQSRFAGNYSESQAGIIGWLLGKGFAKDHKQANTILVISLVIIVAVAVYVAGLGRTEQINSIEQRLYPPGSSAI